MARKTLSLNFKDMNAELHGSDSAIDPLLAAAKITTIKVEGKDVAASDAPLPAKIAALGGLLATGDKTVDDAQLIAANGQLAAQVSDLEGKVTVANATISAQTQKVNELTGKLNTAESAVSTLTAKGLETGNLLKASTDEAVRLTGLVAAQKLALAKDCLALGCIDFKGADGKALAKDATDAQLTESAKDISFADLHAAHKGAVTTFFAKNGVELNRVPANNPAQNSAPQMKRADFLSLDPKAQSAFFASKGKLLD